MDVPYTVVTIITIGANLAIGAADLARAPFVLANSAEVGLPRGAALPLGLLKIAGALGLLAGLLGFHRLGAAAAVGLVLFFVGAVAAHLRRRVLYNVAFPLTYLALAVASLAAALG